MLSHEKNKKTLCKLPLSVRSAITKIWDNAEKLFLDLQKQISVNKFN